MIVAALEIGIVIYFMFKKQRTKAWVMQGVLFLTWLASMFIYGWATNFLDAGI